MFNENHAIEVSKLNLQPGETLIVKIKSNYADSELIAKFRDSIQGRYPDSNVMVLGLSPEDDVEFEVISKE